MGGYYLLMHSWVRLAAARPTHAGSLCDMRLLCFHTGFDSVIQEFSGRSRFRLSVAAGQWGFCCLEDPARVQSRVHAFSFDDALSISKDGCRDAIAVLVLPDSSVRTLSELARSVYRPPALFSHQRVGSS